MRKRMVSLALALCLMCGVLFSLGIPAGAVTTLVFPVNNGCKIAYYYGYTPEYGSTHRGLDIHAAKDTNVYAAAGGTVVTAFNSCSHVNAHGNTDCKHPRGNYLKIKGKDNRFYFYGHLKKGTLKVKAGQKVVAGQKLATMGSSGDSTGRHLHFEVQDSKGNLVNVNPASGNYKHKGKIFTYKNGPYNTSASTPSPPPVTPELPSEVTLNVDSDDYTVGGELHLTASAKGADKITIVITCNGELFQESEGATAVYVFPTEGLYEVYARAENTAGVTESARHSLIVRTSMPLPSNVLISVSKSLEVVGEEVQIQASADNADAIRIVVEWNGAVIQETVGDSLNYTFTDPGEYAIYAIAYNGDGEAYSEREEMTIRPADPSPTPGQEPADRFQDVGKTHYARKAINWALANNITNGLSSTVFGVGENCSRAQAVFFIWAAEGRPEPGLTENPFVDVKPADFFYTAVLWAKENGVTAGKDSTHFNPKGDVSRGQIMTFLYAAKGKPEVEGAGQFTDVKATDYYSKAVDWAAKNGISSGKGGSATFKPRDNCKREEIVTFLYQAYK